jgi:tetratricopeptide (TPR) repeat protein
MATYKKRGYKPKTKAEKEINLEEGSATAEVFKSLDEGASKTEAFIEKNQKGILGVVGVIAVVVLGYLAYQQFIQQPKEEEAMNELFQAQSYFELAMTAQQKDSLYNLSLNGGAGKYGFLDIIDNYGGTDAANVARYYAGMAYLNTRDYQSAIEHLDKFNSEDEMLGPLAKGAIGDAFMQLNQPEEALGYYEQAAGMKDNQVTTPRFLLKAGITAMELGQSDKALGLFDRIIEEFPSSPESATASGYKGKAEAMQ